MVSIRQCAYIGGTLVLIICINLNLSEYYWFLVILHQRASYIILASLNKIANRNSLRLFAHINSVRCDRILISMKTLFRIDNFLLLNHACRMFFFDICYTWNFYIPAIEDREEAEYAFILPQILILPRA